MGRSPAVEVVRRMTGWRSRYRLLYVNSVPALIVGFPFVGGGIGRDGDDKLKLGREWAC